MCPFDIVVVCELILNKTVLMNVSGCWLGGMGLLWSQL